MCNNNVLTVGLLNLGFHQSLLSKFTRKIWECASPCTTLRNMLMFSILLPSFSPCASFLLFLIFIHFDCAVLSWGEEKSRKSHTQFTHLLQNQLTFVTNLQWGFWHQRACLAVPASASLSQVGSVTLPAALEPTVSVLGIRHASGAGSCVEPGPAILNQ